MRHSRRRRNPVLTPEQVFSAVLADLAEENPELAAYAYENAQYFITYADKEIGDNRGSLTEDEAVDQIRSTGKGISKADEKIAIDCIQNYASPQARPADLINRFLALLSAVGPENTNRALIEFGVLARRHGFTTKGPLEITTEEVKKIVGYPECDDPMGGNTAHIEAFVDWMQSDWLEKAKKRAKGFALRRPPIAYEKRSQVARESEPEPERPAPRGKTGRPRSALMGGGPVDTGRGGRRGGGRRGRRGWDEDDWIAWEEGQANKD